MKTKTIPLIAIGNPLLDIQVREGAEGLLKKYNLKSNDAILADEAQQKIYGELQSGGFKTESVAGGAGQNAARFAQYVLPPNSTAYIGCVGKDALARQLREANDQEGLKSYYMEVDSLPTGACAVVLTGHDRSLVTNLGAAEKFHPSFLATPDVKTLLASAEYIYLEGYFVTHGLESLKILCDHAVENDQVVALNLSAPFVAQFFKKQIDELLPYVDILFGNETEAAAFATGEGWDASDLPLVAHKIAHSFKKNLNRPRLVIITQGSGSTIVSSPSLVSDSSFAPTSSDTKTSRAFPVTQLAPETIVDTNAAGDAFAGGFMAGLVLGMGVDQCVELGHRLGGMCCGQAGPKLKWPKDTTVLMGL